MNEELVTLGTEGATKTVAIIYTGGTVASKGQGKPRLATSTSSDLRLHLKKSFPDVSYSHHHPLAMLSEDATPTTWKTIAETIKRIESQENPDSYLVFHGTDTMTWTAAALSFLLTIKKPVVLTGSEYPLDHPLTDAFFNADRALQVKEPGVHISFRGQVFSGTRTRKNTTAAALFEEFPKKMTPSPRGAGLYEQLGQDSIWLRPAPGLPLPEINGPVLLEMYPSWTAPNSWVEKLLSLPYPLFLVTSQGVLPNADYPSLSALEDKGLLLPMLPETAWSKLLCWNPRQDLISWMSKEVADEFISR